MGLGGKVIAFFILLPMLPYVLFLSFEQSYLGAYAVGANPFGGFSLFENILNSLYFFFKYGF